MGLFKPIWMTDDRKKEDKAAAAVGKIKNPGKLYEIALHAPREKVSIAAVERIGDEKMLGDLVFSAPNQRIREAAVKRIKDQNLLAKIAMESKDFPVAHKAALSLQDSGLLLKVAMSDSECASVCASMISDPDDRRNVAFNAPSEDAREAAITEIKDADTLIELLSPSNPREARYEAFQELTFSRSESEPLTDAQREKIVDIILREPDDPLKTFFRLEFLDDHTDDLRLLSGEAACSDIRWMACSCLASKVPANELRDLYRMLTAPLIDPSHKARDVEGSMEWRDALDKIERRIGNVEKEDTDMLMSFIRDAQSGCNMASACIKRLFEQKLDGVDGIDSLRDEAVADYIANITAYNSGGHDENYCITQLAAALPESAREKYGFKVEETERESEDRYGRSRYTATTVTWQGKTYNS